MKQKSNTKRKFNKNNVKYRKSKLSKKKKKVNRNLLKKSGGAGAENDWITKSNGGYVNGNSDYCLWISVFQGLYKNDINWSTELGEWFRKKGYTGWPGPWDSNIEKDQDMLIKFCKDHNIIVNIYKKDVLYVDINQFSTYTPEDGFIYDYTLPNTKTLCKKYEDPKYKSIYVYHTPNHFELVIQSPQSLYEDNNYGVLFPNTYENKQFKCDSINSPIKLRFDSGLQHDLKEQLHKIFKDKDQKSIKYTINALYLERVYNESVILVNKKKDDITEQLTNRAWYLVEYISPFFINYYVNIKIWGEQADETLTNITNIEKLFKLNTKKIDIKDIERISLLFIHLPQLYNLIAKYSMESLNGKEIQVVKTILESYESKKMRKEALNDFKNKDKIKEGHWIWCVLPQPQFLSSSTNKHRDCALDNDYNKGWMQAVILYHNEEFRTSLHTIVDKIHGLCGSNFSNDNLKIIMGKQGDHLKLHSSLLIFNEIAKNVQSYHNESITLFTQDDTGLQTFIDQSDEIISAIKNTKAPDLKDLINQWKKEVKPNIPKVVNISKTLKLKELPNKPNKLVMKLKQDKYVASKTPIYRKRSMAQESSQSIFGKFATFMDKVFNLDPYGAAKAI